MDGGNGGGPDIQRQGSVASSYASPTTTLASSLTASSFSSFASAPLSSRTHTAHTPGRGGGDEILIPLAHGPVAREELLKRLTLALNPTLPVIPPEERAEEEEEDADDLDRPASSKQPPVGGGGEWILRCRLVNNTASVLDQFTASSRRRSSSGRSAAIASSPSWRRESSGTEKMSSTGVDLDSLVGGDEEERASPAIKGKLGNLREENAILRYRLAEVETNLKKALENTKGLHKSQKQLYNDFALLRDKYDDAKAHIAEVLWSYLPAHSPFCPSIPGMQVGQQLQESEKRVGDYDLGTKLGEGQFAKVFICTKHRRPEDGEYALKVINKDKVSSLAALKRVDSEIGAQRTLRHRGILQVHDVINGQFGLYVVMEKGGKDLFDYFDERADARLPEGDCKVLARAVVDAISFCHSRGVCHRDLKPENILLNTDGKEAGGLFQVKLCDFGLCSSFVQGKKLTDFCGSPGFFAPEMITMQAYEGPSVDLWSIGCIVLELSVGHEVFCDEWMIAYDYELLQDPPRFEAKVKECLAKISVTMRETMQLNPDLVDFILGLLTLAPEKRMTVEEIVRHPWIALEDGASFLTGALNEAEEVVVASPQKEGGAGRASPMPESLAARQKKKTRPAPLASVAADAIKEEEEAEEEEEVPTLASQAPHVSFQEDHEVDAALTAAAQQPPPPPGLPPLSPIPEQRTQSLSPPPPPLAPVRSSMSHKVRSKIQEQQQGRKGGGLPLHLPPMEPMTPALVGAKQILWEGDELLQKATEEVHNTLQLNSGSNLPHLPPLVAGKEKKTTTEAGPASHLPESTGPKPW